jgi:RNA polymerase sigma factor (sigma-70 family)
MEPTDDHELIERAIAGDPAASETLVARLLQVIRARARRVCQRHKRNDADDLVQEIWLKLFADDCARLRGYDPARNTSLEGYVGAIAENEAVSLLRRDAAKKRGGHLLAVESIEVESEDANPEENAQANELAARLGLHLEKELSARGMLIFRYAFTDQREPDEVAKLLGVTVQVVYNWQHKIRAVARAFLS